MSRLFVAARRCALVIAIFSITLWATHARAATIGALHFGETQYVAENPGDLTAQMMAGWQSQHVLLVQRKLPFFNLTLASNAPELKTLTIALDPTKAAGYSFDFLKAFSLPAGVTVNTVGPNATLGAVVGDTLTMNFTGLTAGKSVTFQTDLISDPAGANIYPDYRYVLFQAQQAKFVGTFADGSSLVLSPGNIMDSFYGGPGAMGIRSGYGMDTVTTFDVKFDSQPVPEPSTFAMGGIGIAGMVFVVRHRRRKAELSLSA